MMRSVFLVLCLAGFLSGCCGDHEINNGTNGDTTGTPVEDAGNPDPPDVDNSGVAYGERYSTRLTRLQFKSAPAADLNGIISVNLDQSLDEPIIILHEIEDINPEAGSASLRAGSGLRSDEETFTYDPVSNPSSVPVTLDLATGEFSGTFEKYRFVGTIEFNGDVQKVNIPITDLTIEGVLDLNADGSSAGIPQGTWDGHITKADGDVTMIQLTAGSAPRPLTELFREDTLNFDSGSGTDVPAGTGNAWRVRADYTATATTVVQP